MYSTDYIPKSTSDMATFDSDHLYDVPFIPTITSQDDKALTTEYLTQYFLRHRSYDVFVGLLDIEVM